MYCLLWSPAQVYGARSWGSLDRATVTFPYRSSESAVVFLLLSALGASDEAAGASACAAVPPVPEALPPGLPGLPPPQPASETAIAAASVIAATRLAMYLPHFFCIVVPPIFCYTVILQTFCTKYIFQCSFILVYPWIMYKPYLKLIYAVCAIIPGEHKKSSLRKQAALIAILRFQMPAHSRLRFIHTYITCAGTCPSPLR